MTCHKCPHNAEIDRLRAICSKCQLGDKCAVSGTYSLDNMTEGAIDDPRMKAKRAAGLESATTFDPAEMDEPPAAESPEERDRDAFVMLLADISAVSYERVGDLVRLVRAFEGLDRKEVELVQHFLNRGTMASYARAFGLSKQTAWARCKALFRHKPVFQSIANGLLGKLKGGRKPTAAEQPTLFDFAAESGGEGEKHKKHNTASSRTCQEN